MMENGDGPSKKRKLEEPFVRTPEHILRKFKDSKPSLTIHLYPTHFKFEGQDGSFPFEGDASFVLKHLAHKTVPHEMAEELLTNNVTWYDGCLIVEVHNHRNVEGNRKTRLDSALDDNTEKFGMHNWNNGLTPSPMVAYPSQAKQAEEEEKKEQTSGEMAAPERPKEKDGPKVFTTVLFPTELSKHHEILVLANTPASELRGKKRGSDNATPSSAHPPPTPQMSVPPTPITQTARASSAQSQKMCIEEGDLYSFHADLLVATEPPLYLDPVDNPQDAGRLLDFLSDPRCQERAPSPKTRKKTTAEVAADDAQKQETERRMLIMDERIKPVGAGAAQNDNQTGPSSLTFSRFKTIDMVRQRLAQQEEEKKEQEIRMLAEKRAADEQAALVAQNNAAKQRAAREAMMAQQQGNQQHANMLMAQQHQQNQMRARAMQVAQQNAQMNQQSHAHPQQNAMMQGQQQAFQNQTSMPQSSPIVRNQTPMMNSSPMMPQGGFPMAQTSSQQGGAGSPGRPQSAVMQNPMARQVSQQQQGSRTATPQMPQGTPSMAQAAPNRQMTQTPRMQPNSPAPGMQQATPNMPMQTPQMGNQAGLTQEQIQMLRQQQQNAAMAQAQQNGQAGSPPQNMTPEQIQAIQRQHHQQQMMQRNAMLQERANQGDPAAIQQLTQIRNQQQQRAALQQRQAMMAAQRAQMGGQAGSPGAMPQQTPQMGHAHPQQQQMPGQQGGNMPDPSQMTPQQQQALQQRAAHIAAQRANHQQNNVNMSNQIRTLAHKFGSLNQIPPQIFQQLSQPVQQNIHLLRQQQAAKVQQQAMQQQQQQQQNGGEQVPGGQGNPEYMQQLRNNRAMLGQAMQNQAQQQQGQGAMAGMNGMTGLSFQMGGVQQNNAFGNQQNGGDLTQQFAAMQNALTRGNQGGGQGGQGMQ